MEVVEPSVAENAPNVEGDDKAVVVDEESKEEVEQKVAKEVGSQGETKVAGVVENVAEKTEVGGFLYDEEMCSLCNLERVGIDCGIGKEELNHLLTFVLNRIKTWVST